MKSIYTLQLLLSLIVATGTCRGVAPLGAKTEAIHPLWKYANEVNTPESAYFQPETQTLYLSNVGGSPTEKDGNGFILKFAPLKKHGEQKAEKWVTGLNAPKGMRAANGTFYVTDIDELVSVDEKTGKVLKKVPVAGAKFLNDIAIAPDGTVYVSDMFTSKIHTFRGDKVETFVEGKNLECPNGLYLDDGKLYVAAWGEITDFATFTSKPGHLYAIDLKTKKQTHITKSALGNLDGLEKIAPGVFLVSDWAATKVYKVNLSGQVEAVKIPEGKNSADIGVDIKTKTLFIPFMGANHLTAVHY